MIEESIDYDGFEGWVVRPSNATRRPGVLLAHDWSGLNEGIRRVAHRIAQMGHPCFAIDVYGKGIRGDELGDNTHLMAPLMNDRAELQRRLLAGLHAATRHDAFDPDRIVALGFCFGGLCALDLARADPSSLRAAISVHGVLRPPPVPAAHPIRASVLLLHGWEDPYAPPADVLAIARELTDAGADWQLHAYGHAKHAFTFEGAQQPEVGIVYDPVADRRAWATLRSFLAQMLAA